MSHTKLISEIEKVQARLKNMQSEDHAGRLLQTIHRSGWTDTDADLVRVTLDSLNQQLEEIDRTQRSLVAAAEAIGKAKSGSA